MAGFLKKFENLFTYKEPSNDERGFELLEDQDDGKNKQDNAKGQTGNVKNQPGNAKDQSDNSDQSNNGNTPPTGGNQKSDSSQPFDKSIQIFRNFNKNLDSLKTIFNIPENQDIGLREFKIGRKYRAFIVYVYGMIDKQTLNLSVYPQLMNKEVLDDIGDENPIDYLADNILSVYSLSKAKDFDETVKQVLNGKSALFIEDCTECMLIETRQYEKRNIEKPAVETVIKGPQEAFTENLASNIALMRRIIRNEKLVIERTTTARRNNINIAILYIEDLADQRVISEVKRRIQRINTDYILGDGMLEQFIEDNTFMPLPQVLTTERPDRTSSFLVEGKVAVIVDGTPFAIVMPITFFHMIHTSEDSYSRWPFGTFLRFIRFFGLACALLLPGLYTAVVLFHPEMLPTELLISMAKAKESVPFPTIIEVSIMEIAFELIREGGVRVPSVVGQTLGIVGALILGQAAVSAGLVSPILVIVVSVTALGNFSIPNYSTALAVRVGRFIFIIVAALLGFYGISLTLSFILILICSMKSFGIPFLSPIAPKTEANPDVFIRYPIWTQKFRPDMINPTDRNRQGNNVKIWDREK